MLQHACSICTAQIKQLHTYFSTCKYLLNSKISKETCFKIQNTINAVTKDFSTVRHEWIDPYSNHLYTSLGNSKSCFKLGVDDKTAIVCKSKPIKCSGSISSEANKVIMNTEQICKVYKTDPTKTNAKTKNIKYLSEKKCSDSISDNSKRSLFSQKYCQQKNCSGRKALCKFSDTSTKNYRIYKYTLKYVASLVEKAKLRKQNRKRKLTLLVAGGCLSCKRAKPDDTSLKLAEDSDEHEFNDDENVLKTDSFIRSIRDSIRNSGNDDKRSQQIFPIVQDSSGNFHCSIEPIETDNANDVALSPKESSSTIDQTLPTDTLNTETINVHIADVNINNYENKYSIQEPAVNISQSNKETTEIVPEITVVDSDDDILSELPFAIDEILFEENDEDEYALKQLFTGKSIQDDSRSKKKKARDGKKIGKKRPNYFVAIQVCNPQIHGALKEVQSHIIGEEPKLKRALIKLPTLHITLLVCHIENNTVLERACQALCTSYDLLKDDITKSPLYMPFHGLGNFQNKVIFVELNDEVVLSRLQNISETVTKCFEEQHIEITDKRGFKPHLTILKTSKDTSLWKKGIKKINPSVYEKYKDEKFGIQLVKGLQLLSMTSKDEHGYYHCCKELLFDISKETLLQEIEEKEKLFKRSPVLSFYQEKDSIRKKFASLTSVQLMKIASNEDTSDNEIDSKDP